MEAAWNCGARLRARLRFAIGRGGPGNRNHITLGATKRCYTCHSGSGGPADEVILFDPLRLLRSRRQARGRALCTAGRCSCPIFAYDWGSRRAAISPRTQSRHDIINLVRTMPADNSDIRGDLDALAAVKSAPPLISWFCQTKYMSTSCSTVARHCSVLAHTEAAGAQFRVFSSAKTLHATGIRVGYCIAPAETYAELRKVHQFIPSASPPLQTGNCGVSAAGARILARTYQAFFSQARPSARGPRGQWIHTPGPRDVFPATRFQGARRSGDRNFAERLLTEAGVATIRWRRFMRGAATCPVVRLCIAEAR